MQRIRKKNSKYSMDNVSRENIINNFIQELQKYGYEVNDLQINQFMSYYDFLIEWNNKFNLTAITEFEEVIYKHFLDSVSIIKIVDLKKYTSLIDVGTGAGFPGIPIKIMNPHMHVTLLDSLQKRVNFLNTVIDELQLDNINALHGRAEDYAKDKEYREAYDICVSRAVANLSSLSELCIPFVRVNGMFISYKSDKAMEEFENAKKAIQILGGNDNADIKCFDINGNTRTLLGIRKEKPTSMKYPRKAGTPVKNPL